MIKIIKAPNDDSALDLLAPDGAGNLLRFGVVDPQNKGKLVFARYINAGGHEFTCLSLNISGTYKRHMQPDGNTMLEILQPCDDATLGVWADTRHGVVSRAANIHPSDQNTLFRGMNWEGQETFAVRPDGEVECQSLMVGNTIVTEEQLKGLLKLLEGKDE